MVQQINWLLWISRSVLCMQNWFNILLENFYLANSLCKGRNKSITQAKVEHSNLPIAITQPGRFGGHLWKVLIFDFASCEVLQGVGKLISELCWCERCRVAYLIGTSKWRFFGSEKLLLFRISPRSVQWNCWNKLRRKYFTDFPYLKVQEVSVCLKLND